MSITAAVSGRARKSREPRRFAPPREFARATRRPLALGVCAFVTLLPLVPALAHGANLQSHLGAFFAVLLLAFAARSDPDLCERPFALGENGLGVVVILGAALVSAAVGLTPPGTIFGLLPILALAASFFVVRIAVRTTRDHELLATGLALTLTTISIFGIRGYVDFQAALRAGTTDESLRSGWLATPFYPHSYIASQVALTIVPFVFAFLLGRCALRTRLLAGIAVLFGGAFLVLTLSRAAWLASAIACTAVLASSLHSTHRSRDGATLRDHARRIAPWLSTVIALSIAAFLALPTPSWARGIIDGARERVVGLLDPSEATFHYSRVQVWSDSLRLAAEHQPFGVGPGRFAAEFGPVDEGRRFIPHAHDQFLHTLVELGVPGLVGFCLVIVGSLSLARRTLARASRFQRDPTGLRGAFGGILALAIVSVFETPLSNSPCVVLLACFAAITIQGALRAGVAPAIPTPWRGSTLLTIGRGARLGAIALSVVIAIATAIHVVGTEFAHRARRSLEFGDARRAASESTLALKLQPSLDALWWLDAQIRHALGDAPGAAESLRRHAELVPRVPLAAIRRAEELSRHHRHEDALALLLDARHRAPPELALDVDFHLANTLTWLDRDEEARVLYLGLLRDAADRRFPELIERFTNCLDRLDRERETIRLLETR